MQFTHDFAVKMKLWREVLMNKDELFTFDRIGREWLLSKQISIKRSTYVKYENLLEIHLIPSYKNKKIYEIDDLMISAYLLEKSKELSTSTVRTMQYMIQSIIAYSNKKYDLKLKIYRVKLPKTTQQTCYLTNLQQVMIEKKAIELQKEVTHAVFLGLYAGLRIGEICALQRKHIDLDKHIIYINQTVQRIRINGYSNKTKLVIGSPKTLTSVRKIPIMNPLFQYLLKIDIKHSDCFIIGGKESPIDPRKIQYQFAKLVQSLDYENLHFHSLRHTFATNCMKKEIDIKTISKILGHSTVTTTLNLYVHSSFEHQVEQMNRWEKFASDDFAE